MSSENPEVRSSRYHTLDHWRGVACLLVIVLHSTNPHAQARANADASPVAETLLQLALWGGIGVPMFFVISGYCISATALATMRRGHPMKTYFSRRLRRIFPPYWFALAFALVLNGTIDYLLFPGLLTSSPFPYPRPWWFDASQWIGNLTLTESWRFHIFGDRLKFMLQPAWTLCYEEQFYVVAGLILFLGRKKFFTSCVVVTIAALALQLSRPLFGTRIGGYFFDGHWLMFAAGIVVYFYMNHAELRGKIVSVALLFLLAFASITWPVAFSTGTLAAAVFALMLIVLHRWDDRAKNSRILKPLAICGTMCYSLYLIHSIPVRSISKGFHFAGLDTAWETLLITLPTSLAVSLALGWIFYLCVERHFLNPPQTVKSTDVKIAEGLTPLSTESTRQLTEPATETSSA